jgi:hypothetical protein
MFIDEVNLNLRNHPQGFVVIMIYEEEKKGRGKGTPWRALTNLKITPPPRSRRFQFC